MHERDRLLDKGRLEAFSDGVLAVIITIMVLELKVPAGTDLAAAKPVLPTFAAYVLSFAYIAIYWVNHHHLLRAAGGVDGRTMWANLHLLFWLSLVPFLTAWIGQHPSSTIPVFLYGCDLLLCAFAYTLLTYSLIVSNGENSVLARALGFDRKQVASLALYAAGVALAFFLPWVSELLYASVAVLWFVPDRRLERALVHLEDSITE